MINPLNDTRTMNLFMDTEFHDRLVDDPKCDPAEDRVELISIALFDPTTGKHFYKVVNSFDEKAAMENDWLRPNVLSLLPPKQEWVPDKVCASQLKNWVNKEVRDGVVNKPFRIWTWYGSYDFVLLCRLMGGFEQWPISWPMLHHDLRVMIDMGGKWWDCNKTYKVPHLDGIDHDVMREHNALYDAVQLYYKWLDYWTWMKSMGQ